MEVGDGTPNVADLHHSRVAEEFGLETEPMGKAWARQSVPIFHKDRLQETRFVSKLDLQCVITHVMFDGILAYATQIAW